MCYYCVLLSERKVAFARISRNVILYISDVQYEIFYILPITIGVGTNLKVEGLKP